jgi:hypothetical protein
VPPASLPINAGKSACVGRSARSRRTRHSQALEPRVKHTTRPPGSSGGAAGQLLAPGLQALALRTIAVD